MGKCVFRGRKGQGSVEYIIILVLIAIACLLIYSVFGDRIGKKSDSITGVIESEVRTDGNSTQFSEQNTSLPFTPSSGIKGGVKEEEMSKKEHQVISEIPSEESDTMRTGAGRYSLFLFLILMTGIFFFICISARKSNRGR